MPCKTFIFVSGGKLTMLQLKKPKNEHNQSEEPSETDITSEMNEDPLYYKVIENSNATLRFGIKQVNNTYPNSGYIDDHYMVEIFQGFNYENAYYSGGGRINHNYCILVHPRSFIHVARDNLLYRVAQELKLGSQFNNYNQVVSTDPHFEKIGLRLEYLTDKPLWIELKNAELGDTNRAFLKEMVIYKLSRERGFQLEKQFYRIWVENYVKTDIWFHIKAKMLKAVDLFRKKLNKPILAPEFTRKINEMATKSECFKTEYLDWLGNSNINPNTSNFSVYVHVMRNIGPLNWKVLNLVQQRLNFKSSIITIFNEAASKCLLKVDLDDIHHVKAIELISSQHNLRKQN